CDLRQVHERADGGRAPRPARHALQLHLRPLPSLRLDARRAHRLRRRAGRSPRGAARAAPARRQAGGLPRRPGGGSRGRDAARGGRPRRRHRPLPAGGERAMKDVAVLGVGMHRFGMWAEKSNGDVAREAGLAALRDAGLAFRDVQAAYVGHIFAPVMSAVRTMKEFGLTGLPVQHVENASATGSAAFREACFAVASGRHDVVMVLGFDKMSEMIQRSGPSGDGAACAIVGRPEMARRLHPGRPVVRVLASELQTERYERGHLFVGPVVGPARMSVDTSRAAYAQAGLGPEDMDLVQVHDAFAIEELEYYELLGLCGEGEAEAAIERGDFVLGGRVPVSTDGGLIARGHPGGPTGLAQIWETALQLRGEAGKRQVAAARGGVCNE